MNMHVPISEDRTLLPRALIRRLASPLNFQYPADLPLPVVVKRFRFRIGAVVKFRDLTATVVDRSATLMGKQVYTIKIIGEAYGRPVRSVLGSALTRHKFAALP